MHFSDHDIMSLDDDSHGLPVDPLRSLSRGCWRTRPGAALR
jgi:hypothetical protein